jgi:hypothetical protein
METDLDRMQQHWEARDGLYARCNVEQGDVLYLAATARLESDGYSGFPGYSMTDDECTTHSNVLFDVQSPLDNSVLAQTARANSTEASNSNAVILPNFLLTQADVEESLDSGNPVIAYLIVTVKAIRAGEQLLLSTSLSSQTDVLAWMHNEAYCEQYKDTLNTAYNALDAWIGHCGKELEQESAEEDMMEEVDSDCDQDEK